MTPGSPRMTPGWPQDYPGLPQGDPGWPQGDPGWPKGDLGWLYSDPGWPQGDQGWSLGDWLVDWWSNWIIDTRGGAVDLWSCFSNCHILATMGEKVIFHLQFLAPLSPFYIIYWLKMKKNASNKILSSFQVQMVSFFIFIQERLKMTQKINNWGKHYRQIHASMNQTDKFM